MQYDREACEKTEQITFSMAKYSGVLCRNKKKLVAEGNAEGKLVLTLKKSMPCTHFDIYARMHGAY